MFARLVRSPELWAAVAALLIAGAQVPFSHFAEDDFIHVAVMEGRLDRHGEAPFRLYSFLPGDPGLLREALDGGPMPWFTHPEAQVEFCRPLSSLLIALDHAVFGRAAWGYRVLT